MYELNFFVFDDYVMIAGFSTLCAATSYAENYRADSPTPVLVVDGSTGEVLDIWVNGAWENGRF